MTETREHQRRQRLLINELNHRVKNALATVQSLVRLTLHDFDVRGEVEHAITERLIALAATHDVLTREHWSGAELSEVIVEVTRPYDAAGRITMRGPETRLAPKTAIAISLAVQELATNAAKHGALSTAGGRVALAWRCTDAAVEIEWRESGGPPVTPPKAHGFGSLLLGRLLAGQLGQPAELIYAPEGLICRIRAPAPQ